MADQAHSPSMHSNMPASIEAAMVGAALKLIEAPWCRVFHHCTEK